MKWRVVGGLVMGLLPSPLLADLSKAALYAGEVELYQSAVKQQYPSRYAIGKMGIAFEPGGRMLGFIEGTECELSGRLTESMTGWKPFKLIVKACKYKPFNNRYTGSVYKERDGSLQVNMTSIVMTDDGLGIEYTLRIHGIVSP